MLRSDFSFKLGILGPLPLKSPLGVFLLEAMPGRHPCKDTLRLWEQKRSIPGSPSSQGTPRSLKRFSQPEKPIVFSSSLSGAQRAWRPAARIPQVHPAGDGHALSVQCTACLSRPFEHCPARRGRLGENPTGPRTMRLQPPGSD